MNSFTNSLLIFFTIPLMCFVVYVGYDVPIDFMHTTGKEIPYQEYIFLGFGLVYFMLLVWRSIRRWMGLLIVNKTERFKWNMLVSKTRSHRILVYSLLESGIMSTVAFAMYVVSDTNHLPGIILYVFSIEGLIFLLLGLKNKFRVGISSKAVIVSDREVTIAYLTGLRQVTIGNESVYFDYINDLQLSFPTDCIDEQHIESFRSEIKNVVDRDRVLIRNKY